MMDIKKIIEEEKIFILFQPIISIYQERVAGVEALARGIDHDGSFISPVVLFEAARAADLSAALDRLCQRKAIESFAERPAYLEDLILFLNVDHSALHLESDTDAIYKDALRVGVNPENVVLEINESDIADITAVEKFVNQYRSYGFMISIDDIGTGYSNLDRVVLLKPDIIKIDRSLIQQIHRHYFKQQVVDMFIKMAEKTGALIVAEGVEELEEVMTVLQFGAQLLQGFYISKPMNVEVNPVSGVERMIKSIASAQKAHLSGHLRDKCAYNIELRHKFQRFKQCLSQVVLGTLDEKLSEIIHAFPEIECVYVIDEDGNQFSNTIFNPRLDDLHKKSLFRPYKKGDNATLKAYYYVLITTNQPLYVSEEYISLATGHRCITISGYTTLEDRRVILCLDIVKL